MLRLSIRTLFSLTPSRSLPPYSIFPTPSRSLSPYSILTAQCYTSSPPRFTYPHSHGVPDPRNVRVSVWWDLDNCNMPSGVNVFRGAQAITAAIESSGIKGPIQIKAFGDILRLARTDQEALSSTASTAIDFTPIPHGEDEESADSCLFKELIFWIKSNPPPVHLFIITVFGGYTSLLHHLRMNNYNLLLASKESAPAVGCSAATIMWNWDALVRGENLTGRYFNQPPKEYLYGHLYGHYEGPLEEIPAFAPDDQPGEVHEVFSQNSFWVDLENFINSDIGSFISAESRTREKVAYYLRKYGPFLLKSLSKNDVLDLVDILIERGSLRESPYF